MRIKAAYLFLLALLTIGAEAKPIWEIYPTLICRYDRTQFCQLDMSDCKSDVGAAVLTFDFTKGVVRSFVSKTPSRIDAKYFFGSKFGDTNTVFAAGTLYSFVARAPGIVASATDTIEGTAQSTMGMGNNSAFNAHMTCHPN